MKSNKMTLIWVLGVTVAAMAVFVYLILGDTPKTLPKIKLSYFADEHEIGESVGKRLSQEISSNSFYWIGVEPERDEQLGVVQALKNELEKKTAFRKVFADAELNWKEPTLKEFKVDEVIPVKEESQKLGEKLQALEKEGTPYLVLTAAIYSTSLLNKNPLHVLKETYKLSPMTFSLAYFPTTPDEEKNMLFPCMTEDHSGTSDWGCTVINKARFSRRRIERNNTKPWIGLMDLSGEKDYMLLVKRK